jgi:hypothetical protein
MNGATSSERLWMAHQFCCTLDPMSSLTFWISGGNTDGNLRSAALKASRASAGHRSEVRSRSIVVRLIIVFRLPWLLTYLAYDPRTGARALSCSTSLVAPTP